MTPRVTAVLPCHNHAAWVAGAVRSVAGQEYDGPLRIIVVDNGSADGSADAVLGCLDGVRGHPSTEPRAWHGTVRGTRVGCMLVSFAAATGPSFARNYGVRAAGQDADLFAFLDSDDIYLPGKVAASAAKWAEAPDAVGGVYSDYVTLDPATGVRVREYKQPFSRGRLLRECIVNMDSLVGRAALEKVGPFDEGLRVAEDYDLWLRLSERYVLVHVPRALVEIRVGGHSSTATVPAKTWQECHARVFAKLRQRAAGGG